MGPPSPFPPGPEPTDSSSCGADRAFFTGTLSRWWPLMTQAILWQSTSLGYSRLRQQLRRDFMCHGSAFDRLHSRSSTAAGRERSRPLIRSWCDCECGEPVTGLDMSRTAAAVRAGYFTSRPSTKLYSRVASGYVRAARQLEVLMGWDGRRGHNTDRAAKTVALLQHHDAITGTDRFHVNQNYRQLLAAGACSHTLSHTTLIRGGSLDVPCA